MIPARLKNVATTKAARTASTGAEKWSASPVATPPTSRRSAGRLARRYVVAAGETGKLTHRSSHARACVRQQGRPLPHPECRLGRTRVVPDGDSPCRAPTMDAWKTRRTSPARPLERAVDGRRRLRSTSVAHHRRHAPLQGRPHAGGRLRRRGQVPERRPGRHPGRHRGADVRRPVRSHPLPRGLVLPAVRGRGDRASRPTGSTSTRTRSRSASSGSSAPRCSRLSPSSATASGPGGACRGS